MSMDPIFKAKRLVNGEWVIAQTVVKTADNPPRAFMPPRWGAAYVDLVEVDPATLGISIGQRDTNGRAIFEGDIVLYVTEKEKGEVKWDESTSKFVVQFDDYLMDFEEIYGHELEVVGNIHDLGEMEEHE